MKIHHALKTVCFAVIAFFMVGSYGFAQSCEGIFSSHDLSALPPSAEDQVEVNIKLWPLDLTDIRIKDQLFGADLYLEMEWADGRVGEILSKHPLEEGCVVNADKVKQIGIWVPNVEILNMVRLGEGGVQGGDLYIDHNGHMVMEVRLRGMFRGRFDVTSFPFDHQNIDIILQPNDVADDVRLLAADDPHGALDSFHEALKDLWFDQWVVRDVHNQQIKPSMKSYGDEDYNILTFTIEIDRIPNYYLFKVFLPALLLGLISIASLWISDLKDPGTRLALPSSALIAIVTFNMLVGEALPKVAYLTFADMFLLINLIACILVLAGHVVTHVLRIEVGELAAVRFERWRKYIMLPSFLAAFSILFASILIP